MFRHGLVGHQKMPKKLSFQQSQTWYKWYTQVFENAKFLGDLTIFKKGTHNGVYLHWNSFAPRTWKRGTLWTILIPAYKICSNEELLQNELKQIEEKFININGYPKWVFD